jgi:hypothetical protein
MPISLSVPCCSGAEESGQSGEDKEEGEGSSGSEDLGGEFDDADEELYHQRRRQHLRKKRSKRKAAAQGGWMGAGQGLEIPSGVGYASGGEPFYRVILQPVSWQGIYAGTWPFFGCILE